VTGIVDLGVRDLNRRTVFVTLRAAQSLLGLPGGATQLDLKIDDLFEAEDIARRLEAQTGLTAESWMRTNEQLLAAINAQDITTRTIRGFVIVIVALGIASVLVVWVVQKRREIGILRAMGASRGQVQRVFPAARSSRSACDRLRSSRWSSPDRAQRGRPAVATFSMAVPVRCGALAAACGAAAGARRRRSDHPGDPDVTRRCCRTVDVHKTHAGTDVAVGSHGSITPPEFTLIGPSAGKSTLLTSSTASSRRPRGPIEGERPRRPRPNSRSSGDVDRLCIPVPPLAAGFPPPRTLILADRAGR
jgi:hypothetical protein